MLNSTMGLSFPALLTVQLPMLNTLILRTPKSEITEIRQLNKSIGSTHGTEPREVRGGSGGASALLFRLSSRDLVSQIMKKKHKITGLNSQHLDPTHFGENIALPVASVFINEYLPSAIYKEFPNLKSLAKKIGIQIYLVQARAVLSQDP